MAAVLLTKSNETSRSFAQKIDLHAPRLFSHMASYNAPCLPLKLEMRFRKSLVKLTGSAMRIKSKKPKGKKTMKEKKKKEVASPGCESGSL